MKVKMNIACNHTAEANNKLNLNDFFSFNGLKPSFYYCTCENVQFHKQAEAIALADGF